MLPDREVQMFEARSVVKVRWFLVIAACLVTILWLCAIIAPYDPVGDPYGLNGLFWCIIASGLHIICGVTLLIASRFGVVRVYFAILVVFTPFAHMLGSPIEAPWCFLPFVIPSIVIVITGILELRFPPAPGAETINDQEP
jgi:hypothetical protein